MKRQYQSHRNRRSTLNRCFRIYVAALLYPEMSTALLYISCSFTLNRSCCSHSAIAAKFSLVFRRSVNTAASSFGSPQRISNPSRRKAAAIDDLGLSVRGIMTLLGKSPANRRYFNSLREKGYDEAIIKEALDSLADRENSIHLTAALFVESKYFEDALLRLEKAYLFDSIAQRLTSEGLLPEEIAGYDLTQITPDGKIALDIRVASKWEKRSAKEALDKAVEETGLRFRNLRKEMEVSHNAE